MPQVNLTDAALRSLKPGMYWDTNLPAFGVRVGKNRKTFIVMQGTRRIRQTIGHYPASSLHDARRAAKVALATHTGDTPPLSFLEASRAFLEEAGKTCRPRTLLDYRQLLARLPFTGQLADVTHHDLVRALARIKTASAYNHMLAAAKVLFTWAKNRRLISDNPAVGIAAHSTSSRSRTLTDEELRKVWTAAEQMEGHFGTIVRLLIATGQRRGEIAALQTSWIQDDAITLPKEATKNSRLHTFPVGQLCTSLLAEKNSPSAELLFPARGTIRKPFNGWSKSKAHLDRLSGVTDWTLHDLRRTFATNLAALGVRMEVTEASMDESSISEQSAGQAGNPNQKATAVAIAQRNAQTLIQGTGKTLAESMVQYGGLMADIVVNQLSVADLDELGPDKLKYRTLILKNKNINGKQVDKVIKFDPNLLGAEMTDEEKRSANLQMLKDTGYPEHKNHLYRVNPELFARMKYLCRVEPETMFPKNKEFQQALMLQILPVFQQNPFVSLEAMTRKALYALFQGEADDLMQKQQPATPGMPGMSPFGQPTPQTTAGQQAQNTAIGNGLLPAGLG